MSQLLKEIMRRYLVFEELTPCLELLEPNFSVITPEITDQVNVAIKAIVFQVFCGKIPKDMYEDELIPHFERCGHIWDLRS